MCISIRMKIYRKFNEMRKIILIIFCFIVNCKSQSLPQFDAQKAFSYLQQQCDFGPRNPGSAGHQACLEFLTAELKKYAERVTHQTFRYPLRPGENVVAMTNIIANFQSNNTRRILLLAHWDTRPWADQDPNPENHHKPVLGANDGASGVAVLLEIARLIHLQPPPYGIDIVLVDGEDYGSYGNNDSWAIGSREFARHKNPNYNPQFGILLDLIGDKDQQIYIEQNSYRYAPEIVDKIWKKAEQLGIVEFIPEPRHDIMDDHIRLLEVGIPCVDIIDYDYAYWHTIEDTPDKCSPQSLANVGRVVLAVIYNRP